MWFDPAADDAETFMTVKRCAAYMGITEERVQQLVKLCVLRTRYVWG
jgi:hypothetical protein